MTVNQILATGAHLGFTGGGDCHEGRGSFSCRHPRQGIQGQTFAPAVRFHCGITAALMKELSRPCLLEALRQRRTYATTGPRILLDFSVGGVKMGGMGIAGIATVRAVVHAVNSIANIEIFKDSKLVHSIKSNALDATIEWIDPHIDPGEHYYYLRVVQLDGEMAWSSPVWLRST